MSDVEKNKALAVKFFEAMQAGDAAHIYNALDTNGTIQTMGRTPISGINNKEAIKTLSKAILDAFPKGLEIKIYNVIGEGEFVAVEAESFGTHTSGKTYNNQYHFLFQYRNGKILKMKEYLDTAHLEDVLCS